MAHLAILGSGRSARTLWAGRNPASKDSQSRGGPRALAVSNSNAHSTLRSPTCGLRRGGRLSCKPSWRTCQRSLFGRKSEATPAGGDEPSAPDGVTAEGSARNARAGSSPRARLRRTGRAGKRGRQTGFADPRRRERRPDLPVVFEWLDVPAQQRRCADCGTAYVACGYKISWLYEMAYKALLRKVLRRRYCPGCDCGSARPVSAPPVARLGTSQLGTSVWAWCLIQVYGLCRPQAAVARDLAALGLRVPAVDAVGGTAAAGTSVRAAGRGDRGVPTAAAGSPGGRDLLAGAVAGGGRGRQQGPA